MEYTSILCFDYLSDCIFYSNLMFLTLPLTFFQLLRNYSYYQTIVYLCFSHLDTKPLNANMNDSVLMSPTNSRWTDWSGGEVGQ